MHRPEVRPFSPSQVVKRYSRLEKMHTGLVHLLYTLPSELSKAMPCGYEKVPNFETNDCTKALHIFNTSEYTNKNVLHYLSFSADAELLKYKRCKIPDLANLFFPIYPSSLLYSYKEHSNPQLLALIWNPALTYFQRADSIVRRQNIIANGVTVSFLHQSWCPHNVKSSKFDSHWSSDACYQYFNLQFVWM